VRRALLCLIVALSLAACGQSPKEEAYERLQNQVVAIRDAIEARDAGTALQRLTNLRTNVAQLRADGVLSEAETQEILSSAVEVQANLAWIAPAPLTPPAAIPAPVAPVPPAADSNSGGSVRTSDGEKGAKGQKGAKGERGRDSDDDDGDDD
jgi:hypothetical protein